MNDTLLRKPAPSGFTIWLQSLRAYSFPATLVPVFLALAYVINGNDASTIWLFPLYALSVLMIHAGTNVLNDYYDFINGVDTPQNADGPAVLARGIVTPKFMFVSGNIYFFIGLAVGIPIVVVHGSTVLVLGLASFLAAYLYTGRRLGLKYLALGDIVVFGLFGPAVAFAGQLSMTGRAEIGAAVVAVPVALLVTAILHANNLRDLESDRAAGIKTMAVLMGPRASTIVYVALVALAYLAVPVLVILGLAPAFTLLALASLPIAAHPVRSVLNARRAALEDIVIRTAGMQTLFGGLYVIGFFVGAIW